MPAANKWWLGVGAVLVAAMLLGAGNTLMRHDREIAILQTQMAQLLSDVNVKLDRILEKQP